MSINRTKHLKLQYYRKKYGYRQDDIAQLLGLKQSSYSHKENGRSNFEFDEIKAIHTAFNKKAKKAGDQYLTVEDIFFD